ncbi:hypothetical protein S40285_09506 [Stachybotrys chlorohalonatus IBT 40285]|uniref:Uncharacterized protein n=1 Tax=Stachybotrys chlorohalonatus (strain IBT 40285) TaxID=1283841 RepID=A0A084QZ58_STAC4|nr:hypothetical protein S40285_09506 [Stachybotrys chlorohalonata IBT 40285]
MAHRRWQGQSNSLER